MNTVPVLWLHDPTALGQAQGKSEIGWELFVEVREAGLKAAYVDLAHFALLAPVPGDDPAQLRLKARNLAALWPGFADDGAQCLIVFSSTDGEDAARQCVAVIPGAQLTFCGVDEDWEDEVEVARSLIEVNGNWPALA
jgi:hypothetical protein